MDDLRPYICTHSECPQADTQYTSRVHFIEHELQKHEGASLYEEKTLTSKPHTTSCCFCREQFPSRDKTQLGRHVGRHMEEIAFAIVPKTYEVWEFYSDSSEGQPLPEGPPFICTFAQCSQYFVSKSDRTRHETAAHWFWRCGELATNSNIRECASIFHSKHDFQDHLRDTHLITDTKVIKKFLEIYRLSSDGESGFWCGSCKEIVKSESIGSAPICERLDHYDSCRFALGKTISS